MTDEELLAARLNRLFDMAYDRSAEIAKLKADKRDLVKTLRMIREFIGNEMPLTAKLIRDTLAKHGSEEI